MPQIVLDKHQLSGAFIVRDTQWRRKIFWGGLLLLILPPIGWPVALGYRKELISRLLHGTEPVLPEWPGKVTGYFLEGMKAIGVIFGYLAPLYAVLLVTLLSNGIEFSANWLYALLFFCCFPIFSTLSFPLAVLFWTFVSRAYQLPIYAAALLLIAYGVIVLCIPAGFLEVSKNGRYLAAFNFRRSYRTIRMNFAAYVEAWFYSGLLSLIGHFALPFAPWGVTWCYLGIIFEFNALLVEEGTDPYPGSWYEKLRSTYSLVIEDTNRRLIVRCINAADSTTQPCYLLKTGVTLVPLPSLVQRILNVH